MNKDKLIEYLQKNEPVEWTPRDIPFVQGYAYALDLVVNYKEEEKMNNPIENYSRCVDRCELIEQARFDGYKQALEDLFNEEVFDGKDLDELRETECKEKFDEGWNCCYDQIKKIVETLVGRLEE